MQSPSQAFQSIGKKIKKEWKVAFFTCFILGIFVHMPVLVSDIPNHDGLGSMYFDQNMITSGRWFLTVACGFSSYYTLPWLIGILGLAYLGCAAAVLCEILEIRKTWAVALASGLLAVFPALSSVFAYVFTMDGYMLALLLAVLAALLVKKYRMGFIPGAVCLAFSMGIYQIYLSFTMIVSLFAVLRLLAEAEPGREGAEAGGQVLKRKLFAAMRYLYMGVLGVALYFVILLALLALQNKELAGYQGIDGMVAGGALGGNFLAAIGNIYRDFLSFTLRGNVLFQNIFSLTACVLLAGLAACAVFFRVWRKKYWKNPPIFGIMIIILLLFPLAANVILLISPSVTYHLLMRYQWVLFAIGAVALVSNCDFGKRLDAWLQWGMCLAAFVLVFCYSITDNIAYSNLQRRYEKTYAYCVRLLDRIEQTEGYYPGIPIAMVGVVGDDQYPVTDITLPVTSNMIGLNGDFLLYTGENYQVFMKNYLGATLNILPPEAMEEMYFSEEYTEMDSFPGENSVRIIDGILYVKTENTGR